MKQTTKMSRAISMIEGIYNSTNADFWEGELPQVIITCDSESDEGGFIYNILVDIGDDGSIEYIEWMAITQEEMNE